LVPASIRAAFVRADSSAVLAWVVAALLLALAPSSLRTYLHTDNSVVSGGIQALMLACSTLAQLGGRRHRSRPPQIFGLVPLVAGPGILAGAAAAASAVLCALAAAVAGVGHGLVFSGAARESGTYWSMLATFIRNSLPIAKSSCRNYRKLLTIQMRTFDG